MLYLTAIILHLLCAITFGGVVVFEVLLLEGVRKRLGDAFMEPFEHALVSHARKIMPFVVGLLFLSGGYMASVHLWGVNITWSNAFVVLLGSKIVLALSVLVHFVTALTLESKGRMTPARFQFIHFSVATHIVLIVILAKAMFYFSW